MEVNEEKRQKFMENAGKRVNKVMHDIQILEPMARSSVYDFTKEDVSEMFFAMQDALNSAKKEFDKKFEEKAKTERKVFSFGSGVTLVKEDEIPQDEETETDFSENAAETASIPANSSVSKTTEPNEADEEIV